MDLELKEFATTLAVGAFLCVGLLVLVHTFFNVSLLQKGSEYFAGEGSKRTPRTIAGGVGLSLVVFVFGIIGEDLADKFSDDPDLSFLPKRWFVKEGELRATILFKDAYTSTNCKFGPLSVQLAQSKRLAAVVRDANYQDVLSLQEFINRKRNPSAPNPHHTHLVEIAKRVFGPARSTVALEGNYQKELSAIHARISFARALVLYSWYLAWGSLLALLVQSLRLMVTPFVICLSFCHSDPAFELCAPTTWFTRVLRLRGGRALTNGFVLLGRGMCLVLVFAVLSWVISHAHKQEEEEYAKRVFGFLSTMPEDKFQQIHPPQTNVQPPNPFADGISGLARFSTNRLLIVHDSKEPNGEAPRLSLIDSATPGACQPVNGWRAKGVPIDLESICPAGGRPPNEFLMTESGYVKGPPGRIFWIRFSETNDTAQCTVLGTWRWPAGASNIEGVVCLKLRENAATVLAGRQDGTLQWGEVQFGDAGLTVTKPGKTNLPASLTAALTNYNRKITDLHFDGTNIWAVAAHDGGNQGPFRSVIYQLGSPATDSGDCPVALLDKLVVAHYLDGLKVEGLGFGLSPTNRFTFGTDDEDFGGIWRPVE